jgi:hypothetical protein
MKWTLIALTVSLALLAARKSEAASFCVRVTGIPNQCMFDDPVLCQREAQRQGGECALNPASPPVMTSSSLFCVVDASLIASCVYPDRTTCNVEASRRKGACVQNLESPYPEADPYKEKRLY